jgi:signal transduction histidine kinase/ActR/RegA family two-component response regulator
MPPSPPQLEHEASATPRTGLLLLIPPELTVDVNARVRASVLVFTCVLSIVAGAIAVASWGWAGNTEGALICTIVPITGLTGLMMLRASRDLGYTARVFGVMGWLILLSLNVATGGHFVATQIWFGAHAGMLLLIHGWQDARVMVALCALGPAISYALALHLRIPPAVATVAGNMQSATALTLWITACAAAFDHAHRAAIRATEQQRAELERARNEALAAGEARIWFLAQMAHEIRTPMNGVMGMANMLAVSKLDPDQRSCVEVLRTSGDHLLRLLDDTLELARADVHEISVRPTEFDPSQPVHQVVDLWRGRATSKGLRVRVSVAPELPPAIRSDPMRIRQVLSNLVGNAVKYTQRGAVELRVSRSRDRLAFIVQDTGIGISAEDQANLFDPFTRAGAQARRRFGGTGLGLAISRNIAHALGGTLTVDSSQAHGSTFTLEIPLVEAEILDKPLTEEITSEPVPLRVLVVDDHLVNRMVAARTLEMAGHVAATADNGTNALRLMQTERYDAVLMDCHMPDIDGCEVTRRFRAWEAAEGRRRLPIVALTATVPSDGLSSTIAAGMDACLVKPCEPDLLVRTLVRLCDPTAHATRGDERTLGTSTSSPT